METYFQYSSFTFDDDQLFQIAYCLGNNICGVLENYKLENLCNQHFKKHCFQ